MERFARWFPGLLSRPPKGARLLNLLCLWALYTLIAFSGDRSILAQHSTAGEYPRIQIGQVVQGEISAGDIDVGGWRFDYWAIEGRKNQQLSFDAESFHIDTFLRVLDARWNALAEDNDSGSGTNAHLVATLPEDGIYYVAVASQPQGHGGAYTLRITAGAVATPEGANQPKADIAYFTHALDIARRDRDTRREVLLLSQLGKAHQGLSQYDQAIQHGEQALKLARSLGDETAEYRILQDLGDSFDAVGQPDRAILCYEEATRLVDRVFPGEKGQKASLLNNYGSVLGNAGKYDRALSVFQAGLQLTREVQNRETEWHFLQNLSVLYSKKVEIQGETAFRDQSIEYQQQALQVARELGDQEKEVLSLRALALGFTELGKYPEALQHCRQAMQIAKEQGFKQLLPELIAVAGEIANRAKDARLQSQVSEDLAQLGKAGDGESRAAQYRQAIDSARQLGGEQAARNIIAQMLPLFQGTKSAEEQELFAEQLFRMCLEGGPETRVVLRQRLEEARQAGDPQQEMNSLLMLTMADAVAGDLTGALESTEQLLKVVERFPLSLDQRRQMRASGTMLSGSLSYQMGDPEKALGYYEQSLGVAEQIEEDATRKAAMLQPLERLGAYYRQTGARDRALLYYERTLCGARELGNKIMETRALQGMGNIYSSSYNYPRAIQFYQEALNISQALDGLRGKSGESLALGSLALVYGELGQYSRALAYHQRALAVAKEIQFWDHRASELANTAAVYAQLNQAGQARLHLEEALQLARGHGLRSFEASFLGSLAGLDCDGGRLDQALARYQEALIIAREIQARNTETFLLLKLGDFFRVFRPQLQQAAAYYEEVLQLSRKVGDKSKEMAALAGMAHISVEKGQLSQALKGYEQALQLAAATGDLDAQWKLHLNLADAYRRLDQKPAVRQHYEEAIGILEEFHGHIREEEFKISFFEERQFAYQGYVDFLLAGAPREADVCRALEVAENARARAFLDLFLKGQFSASSSGKETGTATAGLEQIRRIVRESQTPLLEYFFTRQDLVAWLVLPEGEVFFERIPVTEQQVNQQIVQLRTAMGIETSQRSRTGDAKILGRGAQLAGIKPQHPGQLLRELHAALLPGRLLQHLPQKAGSPLLVMPHRELSLVPFCALQDEAGNTLLDRFTLRQAPSAGVLVRIQEILKERGAGTAPDRGVLVIGNPDMPLFGGEKLSNLPGAEAEAREIARLYGIQPLLGQAARESAFWSQAHTSRVIHLATHGISFDASPGESFVALAPEAKAGERGDGMLTVAELLESTEQFSADLVVLSACQTGLGQITGDGVQGLSRAFITSGVPSVLVSLWNVDDASTRELMVAFHKAFQTSGDKAGALRQAMTEVRQQYPDISRWAPFVLVGEGE